MSSPYQYAHPAKTAEEAIVAFDKVKELVKQRNFLPNHELIEMTKRDYNRKIVITNYVKKIKSITGN